MHSSEIVTHDSGDAFDRRFYLYPGGIWAERLSGVITTVLGSCVSVCLWDPHARVGGINHFILPMGGSAQSPRYGNHAIPMLIERVLACGANHEDLLAAVFGGASVLSGSSPAGAQPLGLRNVEIAMELLRRAGIAVVRQDVGGRAGRKLVFRPSDGTTQLRRL
jgi:chemotaxis protein CheD